MFYFDGGEQLNKIGASWFTSYYYFCKIDSSHMNWKKIKTFQMRISIFDKTKDFHKLWLQEVLKMNPTLLETNKLGLKANEMKNMAKSLLEKC